MRPYLTLLVLLVLSSCIVVPRTEVIYDSKCQIQFKQMRLDTVVTGEGAGLNCRNNADCIGMLVVMGGVSAASVVISGSIVIVGNTVFWLEKQGRCFAGPAQENTPGQI